MNRYKVSFINERYIILGNVTKCILTCEFQGKRFIVRAQAVCSEDDLYDISIGKFIALTKAQIKARNKVRNSIAIALAEIETELDKLRNTITSLDEYSDHDCEQLNLLNS